MKISLSFLVLLLGFTACSFRQTRSRQIEEECPVAKSLLQGIWMDDETDTPLMHVIGDTIYYLNASTAPVAFKVIEDSLKTYGSQTTSYHIKKQSEWTFWIQTALGEVIHLSKVDNEADSTWVMSEIEQTETETEPSQEVIKKDKVVYYRDVRYHGYAYINPTQIKVYQTEISEEGLQMDNVYYDNIIYICVYQGEKELFGQNIQKEDFQALIPAAYYERAILEDMEFIGVDAQGYQFQAVLCVPNSVSCYYINISIGADGDISYTLFSPLERG